MKIFRLLVLILSFAFFAHLSAASQPEFTPGAYLFRSNPDARCLKQKPEDRVFNSQGRVVYFFADHTTSLPSDGPSCGRDSKWTTVVSAWPGHPNMLHFNYCQDGFVGMVFDGNVIIGAWDVNDGCFRLDPITK